VEAAQMSVIEAVAASFASAWLVGNHIGSGITRKAASDDALI
jgi:hypothetical protein